MEDVLNTVVRSLKSTANALPDERNGPNLRYPLADAVLSAFACFFTQSPSFLAFQRDLHFRWVRSNCQTLFGMRQIPSDQQIRNMLDGLPPQGFSTLFLSILSALRSQPRSLGPFARLGGRFLVALDGIEFHKSRKIHCKLCSVRHTGNQKIPQYFHTMLAAVIVAPGHNRALPLMPEFVRPQDDLGEQCSREDRKQDCELNAAKRWFASRHESLRDLRPVYLGDALYSKHPFCRQILDAGADFLFVVKPGSHPTLFAAAEEARPPAARWLRRRSRRGCLRRQHEYRWVTGLRVRNSRDAVTGTWIEMRIRQSQPDGSWQQTYCNTFFTSLDVTAENVEEIARCARTRWKVENECFNCIARHGQNFKHNFGHGKDGLANVLATLNLLAFAPHTALDGLQGRWQQCREYLQTRSKFFAKLRFFTEEFVFRDWTSLLDTMLHRRAPPTWQWGASPA
ncbi:MAG: ISNCY family transposase [Bryobacterales bacterium]|nr:ISNCY family transposase [Bryobacterales bacterium]